MQRYPRTALAGSTNGMPPDRPYKYGQRRAGWALRKLAEARAAYPEEEAKPKPAKPKPAKAAPAKPTRRRIDPARVVAAVGEIESSS